MFDDMLFTDMVDIVEAYRSLIKATGSTVVSLTPRE